MLPYNGVMCLARRGGVTRQLAGNVEAGGGQRSEVRPGYTRAPCGSEGISGYGMGVDCRGPQHHASYTRSRVHKLSQYIHNCISPMASVRLYTSDTSELKD